MTPPQYFFRRTAHGGAAGMTLVELLVVLVILAGLMTVASVSTASLRERHRAEKTARIGQAIVDALNRSEGLSIVSDLGRPPADTDELKYLFSRDNGVDDPAPAYALHGSVIPDLDPSAHHITNNLAMPALGAGWRGPYCDAAALDGGLALRDGFGGEWVFDGGTNLVSFGRDQTEDIPGENAAWQDRDQTFPFRPQRMTGEVELTVTVSCASSNAVAELHVYYFEPVFPGTGVAGRHFSVTNGASLSVAGGLSAGKRAVFVYAKAGNEYFADASRYLHLRPGNNAVDLTLFRKP
jgi:prepilin-type N-terminal cleavage/methylation domain-containing protein